MSLAVTPGAGALIAMDQVGTAGAPASGEKMQYVKLDYGIAGSSQPVLPTAPLPVQGGGGTTTSVAAGAANTIVKGSPGRLCRILVTTAGSGTGNVLIFDNATTNSGTVIGMVPATIAIGTFYIFDMPATAGITVQNVSSGPVLTISWY